MALLDDSTTRKTRTRPSIFSARTKKDTDGMCGMNLKGEEQKS